MSCVIFDNGTDNAADTTGWFRNGNNPVRVPDNMVNNIRYGDMVTSVLTIESVSLNDIGNGYLCSPSFGIGSDVGVISVAGEYEELYIATLGMYAAIYIKYLYIAIYYAYVYHFTYQEFIKL